jgi:hypothetical protein
MRTQMNVPLEFVESEIAARHLLEEPISIEDIEFDGLSGVVSVRVDIDDREAHKLPWIETEPDVIGVPV